MNVRPVRGDDDPWLTELQLWAVSMGASSWIVDIDPYEPCRVAGKVRKLTVDPLRGCIEATVTDGTSELIARWAIEPLASQLVLAPGLRVFLQGLASISEEGITLLEEPDFRLVALEEASGPVR